MKWTQGLALLVAFLGFSVGYKISSKTFDGKTTARLYEQGRVVAGARQPVKKPFLFDYRVTRRENIILSTKVNKDTQLGVLGLKFGNFITEYGQSLCSAYTKVEVILFGDNVAVSGKHPKLIFTGDCPSKSSDMEAPELQLKEVFPLFLVSDCKANVRVEDQFQLSNGTNVKAINMYDIGVSDPDWIVEKISFIDEGNLVNSEEFSFEQIREILGSINTNIDNSKIRFICE